MATKVRCFPHWLLCWDVERDHWRSLGQVFQACLVAGLGQVQLSAAEAAAVIEQVDKLNAEGCGGSVKGHRRLQNDFES